jgi:hypothetical protein
MAENACCVTAISQAEVTMPENIEKYKPVEPRGFGPRSRGLSGEYAHEQGWGLDVDERTKISTSPQDTDGGTDYEYGARDFGDEPVNTALDPSTKEQTQNTKQSGR